MVRNGSSTGEAGQMLKDDAIYLGTSRKPDDSINKPEYLNLKLANRHGLITGATGTGKTVSLQILTESFSNAGVPVFCADVKGDLSGLAAKGEAKDFLAKRAETIGFDEYDFQEFPVIFWDLFGKKGHQVRTTLSEMGPLLLSRMLDLNETQERYERELEKRISLEEELDEAVKRVMTINDDNLRLRKTINDLIEVNAKQAEVMNQFRLLT